MFLKHSKNWQKLNPLNSEGSAFQSWWACREGSPSDYFNKKVVGGWWEGIM